MVQNRACQEPPCLCLKRRRREQQFGFRVLTRGFLRIDFDAAGCGKVPRQRCADVDVTATTPVLVRWSFNQAPSVTMQKLTSVDVCNELEGLGFKLDKPGVKTRRATRASTTVYVKLDSSKWILVIDPAFEDGVAQLMAVPGVQRPINRFFITIRPCDRSRNALIPVRALFPTG